MTCLCPRSGRVGGGGGEGGGGREIEGEGGREGGRGRGSGKVWREVEKGATGKEKIAVICPGTLAAAFLI